MVFGQYWATFFSPFGHTGCGVHTNIIKDSNNKKLDTRHDTENILGDSLDQNRWRNDLKNLQLCEL